MTDNDVRTHLVRQERTAFQMFTGSWSSSVVAVRDCQVLNTRLYVTSACISHEDPMAARLVRPRMEHGPPTDATRAGQQYSGLDHMLQKASVRRNEFFVC
jgi:hypothetical protein